MVLSPRSHPRSLVRLLAFFLTGLCIALALAVWLTPVLTNRLLAQSAGSVNLPAPADRAKAPEFPENFKWLNTDQPLSFDKQLKGHVVVLDFWTYCCINCMHILPDLSYLEHKYADQPVTIIGVHSAKFENEQDPAQIAQAIRRYRIHHPVIVDQKMRLWNGYHVNAWPTFVIIDSPGRIVGRTSGEGRRDLLDNVIQQLLEEGKAADTLAKVAKKQSTPDDKTSKPAVAATLRYPGKIISDGKRLFIADSNHDRILITDLTGKVQRIIGAGSPGFIDGAIDEAQFFNPQGMAISADGQILYVADTNNHAVRIVDLKAGTVATLAGDGTQGYDRTGGKTGMEQKLSSPWDVALDPPRNRLIVAMAGLHQIWTIDLKSHLASAWIGSGRENILDGSAGSAALAQTSGLSIDGKWLYFADSETSSIRQADLSSGRVTTLVGTGLFDFGLRDGTLDHALLQHPLGVAAVGGRVYVADTYNHALRCIDTAKQTIATLIPDKGDAASALNEPGGLCIVGDQIYIADTNHNRIVRYDPVKRELVEMHLVFSLP